MGGTANEYSAAQPVAVDAAHGVAGEGGIDVAIGEHDGARLERGQDLGGGAAGEVGGVDQAERHRRQQVLAFAEAGCGFDDGRRVPLAEDDQVAEVDEPLAQQVELGALARAVDALDDDQSAGDTGAAAR